MSDGCRSVVSCVAVISGLFGFDPVIGTARAQDATPMLVRVEDRRRVGLPRNRIVVRDPRTGVDREVYRSRGHIPYEVTVSPDVRYFAFIEVVSQSSPGKYGKRQLTVIEHSGRILRILGESSLYAGRGIREHVWCCGPDKLAIITGGLADEGAFGESTTLPHGLSIVDLRSGVAMPIEGVVVPQQIHWAEFDSSLYIKGTPQVPPGTRGPVARPIYRYHVPSGRLSRSAHRGVFFAPDGRYYFDTGVAEASGSFQLYRTADDQDVTARLAVAHHHLGPEGGWMPGAGHVVVFVEKPAPQPPKPPTPGERVFTAAPLRPRVFPDRWNLAVDAETGRVVERFQGDIAVGWKTNAPALPIERSTGIDLIPLRRP